MSLSDSAEQRLASAVKGFLKYKVKLPAKCGVDDHSKKHAHTGKSVRAANYKGHNIEVVTHYEIRLDNKALPVHVEVRDDGSVHCHSLPNYSFKSAIQMVRRLIDAFDQPTPRNRLQKKKPAKYSKSAKHSK